MLRVVVPFAVHKIIACRAWLAARVVVDSVTSPSVLSVVVPATAVSSKEVILSFTVVPQVPCNSPVTGSAKPSKEVAAVVILKPQVLMTCQLGL